MRRLVLALGFVAATAGIVGANGRPAGTSTINLQQGKPQHIAAGMPFGIMRSEDDGMTFPVSGSPGVNNDWWDSMMIAPSNASRIYLTGYRYKKVCSNYMMTCTVQADCGTGNTCDSQKVQLLFRSDNGGTSYSTLPQTGIALTNQSP